MQFNAEKCKVMHVGQSNQWFQYSMGPGRDGGGEGRRSDHQQVPQTVWTVHEGCQHSEGSAWTSYKGLPLSGPACLHPAIQTVRQTTPGICSTSMVHLASRGHQSPGGCPDPGSEDGVWPKNQGLP